jgi:hypothetical protein
VILIGHRSIEQSNVITIAHNYIIVDLRVSYEVYCVGVGEVYVWLCRENPSSEFGRWKDGE